MIHLLLLFAGGISCPVLNTATARGAIGEVQASVTHSEKNAGFTCRFAGAEAELTVEVSKLTAASEFAHFAESACEGGREVVPLTAIGNEAFACSLGAGGQIAEKVVSRVRNQAFVIQVSASDKAATVKSMRRKIMMLAEQVAGNLF